MAGIYLHVPFCKQACYYCDFHFSTDTRHTQEMIRAMLRELELRKGFIAGPLKTVYFGGGTPSLLSEGHLASLLDRIRDLYPIYPDAEITLEANPDDLSPEKLRALKQSGVNRLSIGIQSFDDAILKYLHRAHDSMAARRCLDESAKAGFNDLSLDLIYAIPGMTLASWKQTLRQALVFGPAHLSAYGLTIEDRTVFGQWKKKNRLIQVSEDEAASQFESMQDILVDAGYEQYEISNFSLPGFHSRHNSSYWMQEHYLGIGPGAHSYDGARRYLNVRNNALYVKAIMEGQLPAEEELLTRENKINEYLLTRLRTQWGCNLLELQKEFSDNLFVRRGTRLQHYQDQGLITITNNILQLTRKGKLLADQITEELMI